MKASKVVIILIFAFWQAAAKSVHHDSNNSGGNSLEANQVYVPSVLLAVPVSLEGAPRDLLDCVQTYEGTLFPDEEYLEPEPTGPHTHAPPPPPPPPEEAAAAEEEELVKLPERGSDETIILEPIGAQPTTSSKPKKELPQILLPSTLTVVDLQPYRMRCSFYRFSDFRDNFDLMVLLPGGPQRNCTMWSSYCSVVISVATLGSTSKNCFDLYNAGMEVPTDADLKKYGELNIAEILPVAKTCEPGAFTNLLLGRTRAEDYKYSSTGMPALPGATTMEPQASAYKKPKNADPTPKPYSAHFDHVKIPDSWKTPYHAVAALIVLIILVILIVKMCKHFKELRITRNSE